MKTEKEIRVRVEELLTNQEEQYLVEKYLTRDSHNTNREKSRENHVTLNLQGNKQIK
jgi:hypothetical protein